MAVSDNKITIRTLREKKHKGEKFACLTAYDASFARLEEECGVDVVLVGDSLGMVIQGEESTVAVTVDHIIYHSQAVARGLEKALLMADMPFMSYATVELALHSATRIMQEGHAHMVKLEGGRMQRDVVHELSARGIPVCAHLGLQPQSVHKIGGYVVQGRDDSSSKTMLDDAFILQDAGADMVLLECVPAGLAAEITRELDVPVIGIGAGAGCDAQVLVLHDMLGVSAGMMPRFVKDFLHPAGDIRAAVRAYVDAVRSGEFPAAEHSFE